MVSIVSPKPELYISQRCTSKDSKKFDDRYQMKPFAEKIFLIEIISQIKGARRALDQLRKAISDEGNAEATYDHAVDFLNHAAVVSKILSPQKRVGAQMFFVANI